MFLHARRAALAAAFLLALPVQAAELGSFTLSPTQRVVTLPTRVYNLPNPSGTAQLTCNAKLTCDYLNLTVNLPADWRTAHPNDKLRISASWPTHAFNDDYDLTLFNSLGVDVSDGQGGTQSDPEAIEVPVQNGANSYRVRVVPYYVRPQRGDYMSMRLELVEGAPVSTSTVQLGGPEFENYVADSQFLAVEPTLDVNLNTDRALMIFYTSVLRAEWNDNVSPPAITWTDVTDPAMIPYTADPILSGDQFKMPGGKYASRMFVAQLAAADSHMYWTDDDGASWKRGIGGGQPHGADNESLAAGPYPAGYKPIGGTFGHALYYCSHATVQAFCSRSDTGGLSWNPSKPIFPATAECSNHGHVKVGIDGTAYVPMNNSCEGAEGVSVSVDAGNTWTWIKVPSTVQGRWDSSIAIANDGKTLYYAYGETGTDRPMILKGTLDKSIPNAPKINWQLPAIDVGVPANIRNMVFSTLIAGDPDRAAFAFHGTSTPGDSNDFAAMASAVWHLYVATTFDGGKTWNLRDVTPNDPTQKGAICHGTVCDADTTRPPDRNLSDFMDMVADSKGRLLIGYADGCTGDCALPGGAANYTEVGVIARQTKGKRMYAAFDPITAGTPGTPSLSGFRNEASVNLNWEAPEQGGSAITGYVLQRSVNGGSFRQIATPTLAKYTDESAVDPNASYVYRAAATNSQGAGSFSASFTPARPAESACATPGLTIFNDPEGDILKLTTVGSPLPQQIDWLKFSLAQPDPTSGGYRFTFTLRVKDLTVVPPGVTWPVQFSTGSADAWEVHMTTVTSPTPVFELLKNGTVVPGAIVTGSTTAAGEISMTVRASDLGLNSPGTDALSGFLSRVALADSITPDNMPDNFTPAGRFDTVGARVCAPNAAPVANLAAVPNAGTAPLSVRFVSSGSTDPDGDGVARYVLEFGDGTGESVQTSAVDVFHTYTSAGTYGARLRVVDGRGKPSANWKTAQIVVQ
jgi:PKD repeat protein